MAEKENITISGAELFDFISELYPICRSITGNGVRDTLKCISKHISLSITEIPSGTKILDWEVPREWNIRDAYIRNSKNEKIVDFQKLNLHVLNYSIPVRKKTDLQTLKKNLYSIPEKPEWVPYRTSYYAENWGFCLSHNQLLQLVEDEYEVCIDSSLESGHLTYAEAYIPGKTKDEVLISTHICHPSLCNDNLSGIAVNTFVAKHLQNSDPYYSYRFLFIPGTIGAIAWLAQNKENLGSIKYGLVTSLLGLDSVFTYKRSRRGNSAIDRMVEYILEKEDGNNAVNDFIPYGYDERQFCSPGFNLPVGNLTRVPFGEFPEYHTSADNLTFISKKGLEDSFRILQKIIQFIESDRRYQNLFPYGEPHLGKRGLYDAIGGLNECKTLQLALLWILNYSDGMHSISDIAMLSDIDITIMAEAASLLCNNSLLKEVK
jgi:aminopeptidase-like protein